MGRKMRTWILLVVFLAGTHAFCFGADATPTPDTTLTRAKIQAWIESQNRLTASDWKPICKALVGTFVNGLPITKPAPTRQWDSSRMVEFTDLDLSKAESLSIPTSLQSEAEGAPVEGLASIRRLPLEKSELFAAAYSSQPLDGPPGSVLYDILDLYRDGPSGAVRALHLKSHGLQLALLLAEPSAPPCLRLSLLGEGDRLYVVGPRGGITMALKGTWIGALDFGPKGRRVVLIHDAALPHGLVPGSSGKAPPRVMEVFRWLGSRFVRDCRYYFLG